LTGGGGACVEHPLDINDYRKATTTVYTGQSRQQSHQ